MEIRAWAEKDRPLCREGTPSLRWPSTGCQRSGPSRICLEVGPAKNTNVRRGEVGFAWILQRGNNGRTPTLPTSKRWPSAQIPCRAGFSCGVSPRRRLAADEPLYRSVEYNRCLVAGLAINRRSSPAPTGSLGQAEERGGRGVDRLQPDVRGGLSVLKGVVGGERERDRRADDLGLRRP